MFLNLLRISFTSLRTNKMRTFLTMLGIIIGISSIIAFITIGEGVTYAVIDQLSGLGGNRVNVSIQNTTVKSGFTDEELAMFEELKGVKGISPTMRENRTITLSPQLTNSVYHETTYANRRVMGVNNFYFSADAKNSLKYGRVITIDDIKFSTNVCVLGYQCWETFYGNYNPVGETIKIANVDFTIVGVMNKLVGIDVSGNNSILVPYTMAVNSLGMGHVRSFDVVVDDDTDMQDAVDRIDTLCSALMSSDQGRAYSLTNRQEVMDMVVTITDLVLGMLAGIAAIALLVGGIGIMNMMLVTVSERTAEIGLRKALGAKPYVILLQFLLEAVMLSLVGGILGVLFGLGLSGLASFLIGYAFSFKLSTILAATGFSFFVGVIFGILPARKAAKMNPIEALRSN
ncbi:MAG: ABC transporter permease [Clostridia bacterium]|nr:ABC transporter permease [Clostridia bacterium]